MTTTKKNLLTSIITIIVLALTATIYFLLPRIKEETDNIIFACVIGTEVLSYINLLFYNTVSSKRKLALAAGGYTITAIYLVLSVIASLVFGIYYRDSISTYKTTIAVLTAFFIIAVILIYLGAKKVTEKAKDIEYVCSFFKNLEYKTESLYADAKNEEISKELRKIQDAIKSCDQSSSVETDNLINQNIDLLREILNTSEINMEKFVELSDKIMSLIKQRSIEVSQLKMGGI